MKYILTIAAAIIMAGCASTGISTDVGRHRYKDLRYTVSKDSLTLRYKAHRGESTTVHFTTYETLQDFLIEDLIGMD